MRGDLRLVERGLGVWEEGGCELRQGVNLCQLVLEHGVVLFIRNFHGKFAVNLVFKSLLSFDAQL